MWKTVLRDYNTYWEPLELRSLKRQLANLKCKCNSCDKNKELMKCRHVEEQKDPEIKAKDREIQAKHREIQAKPSKRFLDSFVQTTVSPHFFSDGIPHSYFPYKVRDDISCPSCYVTMNLRRYGFSKVTKDAEIETKHEMFSCDKSTENTIKSLEKTTSLSLSDDTTEQTSQSNMFLSKKSSHREVTFLLEGEYRSPEETISEQFSFNALVGNCVCIDNYIDSIRPPWTDY